MEDCISNSYDIADPRIYTMIFHVLTAIEIPIHIFGIYCILWKTPIQMSSVTWLMLNCHILNVLLDLSISFLSIPFIFHPTFSGVSLGILDFPELEVYLVLTLIGLVVVSIWGIYENRYYVLFAKGNNTMWCWIRKPIMVINYLAAIMFFIPPYFVIPNQTEAYLKTAKGLPCRLEPSYDGRKVFLLSDGQGLPLYCICFVFVLTISQCIPLFIVIIIKLILQGRKKESAISSRTVKIRKKFVIALVIQTVSPFFLISLPVEYLAIATFINYYNRSLNCFSVVLFSLHGICSTLTMIFIHQPYRDVTIDTIYKLFAMKRKTINSRKISVIPPAIQL
ncbi:hypothetical protein GCK72_018957 [Caenorhabditis remanei]|uniref:Serpentine Receptor, class H n=1 Tax=Caenorhabditis remanei TaxID=31234 RepID=A0A6A5GD77_CAERE|nr:hypothetical protein GCK72_018957 [Caenorhabditis remanei]KAF1752402.1 hypothetical protein GCK72_018957 [Caenorhabditis remanei]